MSKRTPSMALASSEQGQISIFFSASLIVFVSIIAFVINVGLFVKAKINLQNATDAAAYSGAAVQSRQLTKIAYLNWEMRNIYKEWMFKYYVVGSLNAPGVENLNAKASCTGGECTDFRLITDVDALSNDRRTDSKDNYNFPAVCIHIANSKTNVCKRFAVPGLPEFGGYSIPGTEEASRTFFDALIGSKINDCVSRSQLNMRVATTWAYNVLSSDNSETLAGRGPPILTDRQGAWPRAMEVAMRIRNLEKVVNREPAPRAVCIGGVGSCDPIDNYANDAQLGNERIVKAFYSGYRNLGNASDNEMKNSFSLTELSPKPFPIQADKSNSNLLIPTKYEKKYLDLKLMMVNYATFYAALIPRADSTRSGACDISKVAIPIPGYPMGYFKNPDVLTYYAVKGEADFVGLFNPFSSDSIKLTAFAAAKPAGGRIGPMLFTQEGPATKARTDAGKYRSVPYISSLNVVGTPNRFAANGSTLAIGEFAPGAPLPVNVAGNNFWLTDPGEPLGGWPESNRVLFGIPNLPYDFNSPSSLSADDYTINTERLHKIQPFSTATSGVSTVGLYKDAQFAKFRGNLGGEVSPEMLNDHLARIKAPTRYETANYMVPSPNEVNMNLKLDSFGLISGAGVELQFARGVKKYQAEIYAPLYKSGSDQQDILYESTTEVMSTLAEFMRAQKPAMLNYVHSLNSAALQTYKSGFNSSAAAAGARARYKAAAQGISDIDIPDDPNRITAGMAAASFPKSCNSLSGQFWHFYYGDQRLYNDISNQVGCPVTLISLLDRYYASAASDQNYSPTHYKMDYNLSSENFGGDFKKLFTAYVPGQYNGIGQDGLFSPPPGFDNTPELMRRNFYSTKLVSLDSVQGDGNYNERLKNFVIYSEGELTSSSSLNRSQGAFVNTLDSSEVRDIKY